jgi:hypothetical protein
MPCDFLIYSPDFCRDHVYVEKGIFLFLQNSILSNNLKIV